MKAVWGCLLVAGFLMGTAYSLSCYTCSQVATAGSCLTQTCPSGFDSYCKKLVIPLTGGTSSITKSCVQQCTEGSESTAMGTGTAYCCNSDLCNGAPRATISYALLALLAGGSALLLGAGL